MIYETDLQGKLPPVEDILADPKYIDADMVEIPGFRICKVIADESWRTYYLDPDGVWQRTRKFPMQTKEEALKEILVLFRDHANGR